MKILFFLTAIIISFSATAQTARIEFTAPFQYPEGIAFHQKSNRFYVSSAKTGTIGTVSWEGKYDSVFIDSSLKSSFGLKIDEQKNMLWACVGDPNYSKYLDSAQTFKKMIRVIGINLTTYQKTHDIDLSGVYQGDHFANDLVMDKKGNVYITDSYSPVVYQIDASGKAKVFAENKLFAGIDIGLNGIAIYADKYLLVANNGTGSLLKINMANPSEVTPVNIDQFFPGADGLLWDDRGHLILIQNKGSNKIYQLASTDEWKSAKVIAATQGTDRFAQPSTGALANGKVYVLNSKLNELSDPTAQPSITFSIQLARFITVQ